MTSWNFWINRYTFGMEDHWIVRLRYARTTERMWVPEKVTGLYAVWCTEMGPIRILAGVIADAMQESVDDGDCEFETDYGRRLYLELIDWMRERHSEGWTRDWSDYYKKVKK